MSPPKPVRWIEVSEDKGVDILLHSSEEQFKPSNLWTQIDVQERFVVIWNVIPLFFCNFCYYFSRPVIVIVVIVKISFSLHLVTIESGLLCLGGTLTPSGSSFSPEWSQGLSESLPLDPWRFSPLFNPSLCPFIRLLCLFFRLSSLLRRGWDGE